MLRLLIAIRSGDLWTVQSVRSKTVLRATLNPNTQDILMCHPMNPIPLINGSPNSPSNPQVTHSSTRLGNTSAPLGMPPSHISFGRDSFARTNARLVHMPLFHGGMPGIDRGAMCPEGQIPLNLVSFVFARNFQGGRDAVA